MKLEQILMLIGAALAGLTLARLTTAADVSGTFKVGGQHMPTITGGQVIQAASQPVDLWTMFFVVLAIGAIFTLIILMAFIGWSWRFNKDNKDSSSADAWKIQDKLNREMEQVLQDGSKDRETFRKTVSDQSEKALFQTVAKGQEALFALQKSAAGK